MTEEEPELITELNMTEHTTFVRSSEEFVLKRCEDGNCMCGKVHCPFCDTDHYKPTQPARVRDHLNLMHFMHAVHYDGMMIVKCFRECTPGIPAGHYHCPHCERQIGKRAAFSRHLQGHLEKLGKDISVVKLPDFKQPGKIVFDGNEIPLCTKVCEDALGRHYHCPLCTTKNFSELGPMMAHLWRCREESRQATESPTSTPKPKKAAKKTPAVEMSQTKKIHQSIVKSMADLPVQRCNSDRCCDKRYHCPLCPKTKYKPGLARELRDHFQIHWKARIEYKDLTILSCNNNCRDRRSNRSFPHYHCPECDYIFQGKDQFETHLKKCSENLAANKTTVAPSPRGRGRPRKTEKKPEEEAPLEVEVELQELHVEEEEPPPPVSEPPPPPKPGRGRPSVTSKERAILTLAQSSDDEMEAFDKVTAVISKKIIASLAATTSVEDVLDDVSRNTCITWSWSPGTVEPVYVMSGDLISLVKAKRLLKELKEEYEQRRRKEIESMDEEREAQDYDAEPPLHFEHCDTHSVDESNQVLEEPPSPEAIAPVPEQRPLQVVENINNVAELQTSVSDSTMDDIGSGELHISAEEPVNPNTFDTIQGETILTDDILQSSVIISADSNGIVQLPQVSVEEIPQASVSDLQMGQNFADSLLDAASADMVVEEVEGVGITQQPSAQLSVNIFQPDFENTDGAGMQTDATTIVIENLDSSETDTKPEENLSAELLNENTPKEIEKECISVQPTKDLQSDSPEPSETMAGTELQEKIFDDQSAVEVEEGITFDKDEESVVKAEEIEKTLAFSETLEPVTKSVSFSAKKDDDFVHIPPAAEVGNVGTNTPKSDKPSNKREITDKTDKKLAFSFETELIQKSTGKKRKSVPFTPERKYLTRGIKVNFSELHSGKKQSVVESSDEEEDESGTPSPRKSGRGRGRPPGSGGVGRGRPPSSGGAGRGRPPKRGRGRPPKRGRGRPPKRARLEVEEEDEEGEEEECLTAEELDDSDKDPDFVMKEKSETDGDGDGDGDDENEIEAGEDTPRRKSKLIATPVETHIASIPVIRFAGQPRGQKESKEPEECTLDTFLKSIKTELIDPEYSMSQITENKKRGRGRGKGRGRRRDTFDNFFLDEAFKQHPCLECPFLAESFCALTDHLIEDHKITDHMRCDVCEKSFNRKKHMTHHLIMKHGPIALADGQVFQHGDGENAKKCSICGWESEVFSDLTDHYINEHHAFDVLRCDICEMVFKKARHRTTHVDNVHGPINRKGTYVCDLCGHTCDKQRSLNWHKSYAHNMSTKKNPDILYCRKCDFETKEPSEMREHKRTHVEDRKWCEICQKSFSATTDMKTHRQAVHLKAKLCSCNVCGKTFSHWRYLTAHMERHTGEKKHLCNVCGQRFSKAAILREHIETHKVMSERNYKHICQYCDARYYSKDKFMDHLNKHTGAKPHVCEECGKGFSFRSMLLKHRIYVHTTDRPFKCDCCDKAFKFKQILKNHMVLHTGESRYICEGCKKPFSCSATLKTHRPKCRGDQSWQKRKSGVAKAVAANTAPTTLMVPKQEYQELNQLQLHPQQIQQVQVDAADLQQVHVAVSQPNLTQLVDTIVVEMGDGQRSIVDLNSLEAATQLTETDSVATGIYLCSVCNAMFDTVNAAEDHIAQAHAPGKPDVDEASEKLELEEVMEAEADANISNLISELETKVKAKLDPSLLVGLKTAE